MCLFESQNGFSTRLRILVQGYRLERSFATLDLLASIVLSLLFPIHAFANHIRCFCLIDNVGK